MKQTLVLSILLLLSLSSSLVAPIHARSKSPAKSPVAAPGPSNSDCSTIIFSMMDCLSYLSIPTNDTKPDKACCDGIETVLEYNPKCICDGLATSKDMGFILNNTRALATPKTCKLHIAAPHCDLKPQAASPPPKSSTPAGKPATPTKPSAKSPKTSPSLPLRAVTAPAPAPSSSGTSNLSVQTTVILFAVMISSIVYISAFFN